MTFPTSSTFVAGAVLTAAQLNALRADLIATDGYVEKTADQSVTSSTVLVNDTHLVYTIGAVGTYVIEANLWGVSAANAAGHLSVGFTFPTGTMHMSGVGPGTAIASGSTGVVEFIGRQSITSGVTITSYGLSTTVMGVIVRARLAATATGTLRMQWAQAISNASASTLKAGSYMTVKQVA